MKLKRTEVDTFYAGRELASALGSSWIRAMMRAHSIVERYPEDKRTLVVVFLCPCCCEGMSKVGKHDILVSAFPGIDPASYRGRIEVPDKYPTTDGVSAWLDSFEQAVRRAIEKGR